MYTSALALRTTLITAVSLQLIPSMQSPEHRYLAIAFCTWPISQRPVSAPGLLS